MIEGTYRAVIKRISIGEVWYGTIKLENNIIIGSDDDNYYSFKGRYELDNISVKLEFLVSKNRDNPPNPLSSLPTYSVILKGTRGVNHIELDGYVVEEPEKKINVVLGKQLN